MRSMLGALVVVAIASCGGPPPPRLPIAVAMFGDPALGRAIRDDLAGAERFDADVIEIPPPAPELDPVPIEQALARARSLYLSDGDYDRCKEALADQAMIASSLGADRRDLASRILLWRVTCLERAGNRAQAQREAEAFAVLGLDPPADIEAVSIEAQTLLVDTIAAVRARPRSKITIVAAAKTPAPDGAGVVIDGARRCPLPCVVDLVPGDHVLRLDALGVAPDARIHRTDGAATIELPVRAADPRAAASQWHRRFGTAKPDELSSPGAAALLRQATRAERLAVVTYASGPSGAVFGRLVDDGSTLATVRRGLGDDERAVGATASALVDQLLVDARLLPPRRPPLVRRWWFWFAVAGVATAATLTTYYFVAPRDVEPDITLRRRP
jgi:hypothetical protein